eukprot:COSAG03_NODE_8301_length_815_cov_3.074022_2_plen_82_part_00
MRVQYLSIITGACRARVASTSVFTRVHPLFARVFVWHGDVVWDYQRPRRRFLSRANVAACVQVARPAEDGRRPEPRAGRNF